MLNTKEIVATAIAAGATKFENVTVEGVDFTKADEIKNAGNGVDYYVSVRLDRAIDVIRDVDGKSVQQKAINILITNIGFMAMLREAFMRNPQLMPLVRFLRAIDADAKEIAAARKSGDNAATTPLMDLLLYSKVNILCRKVEKDTKVKSIFSLNEKEVEVKNDQYWYDPYDLVITRIDAVSYELDATGELVEKRVLPTVIKRYLTRTMEEEKRRAAAKANGGFTSGLAARAAAASAAANNLPEE